MRPFRLSWIIVVVAPLAIGSLARANDHSWRFNITPYLWLPSVNTELAVDDVPLQFDVDTDSSDLFDQLEFAALICGEVRKGKIGFLFDVQALKVGADGTTGLLNRDYDADISFGDATMALGYRIIEEPKAALDLFAGGRVMYADVSVNVVPGVVLPAIDDDESKTWVDPIIGAKARFQLSKKWGLFGYADIGGFGVSSKLTYQLMGTVFYDFNEHFAIHAGYRVFAVSFEDGDFEFDATMYGPLVGLSFSF